MDKDTKNEVPLEFLDSEIFGEFDEMQTELVCKHDALDIVLIENANEIVRQFIIEDENNLETLLKMLRTEEPNSIYLRSDTINIQQNKSGIWKLKKTAHTRNVMNKYTSDLVNKIQEFDKFDKNTIIYTIFGLNLSAGGHYGAIVCDMSLMKVYVFDSMSGQYGDMYSNSGTEECFLEVARQIYTNAKVLKAMNTKLNKKARSGSKKPLKFELEATYQTFYLQPTGGFEELIAPELESIEDKELQMKINVQHVESQNHFCYIWSTLFCQIYLRGKIDLWDEILDKMNEDDLLSLVLIKKYILGFMKLIEAKSETRLLYPQFFYKHFPRIWSNHENPRTMKFKLYNFEYKSAKTIIQCLDNIVSIDGSIFSMKKTNSDKIRSILGCPTLSKKITNMSKELERLSLSSGKMFDISPSNSTSSSTSTNSTSSSASQKERISMMTRSRQSSSRRSHSVTARRSERIRSLNRTRKKKSN